MTSTAKIARHQAILYGSFGGWNSGDEAILESVERLLGWSHSDIPVGIANHAAVVCFRARPGYEEIYKQQGRFIVRAKELLRILKLLRHRQLIIGGGQIITGDRSYKGLLNLFLITTLARFFGKRAVMVGIGVEGVHRRFAKWLCRRVASNVQTLNCRDVYSQQMLLDAGCRKDRIHLAADVVLSGVIACDRSSRARHSPSRTLAIGLHHANWRTYTTADELIRLTQILADAFPEHRIVLVSNDCREGFDEGLLRQLKERIEHPRVDFISFEVVDEVIACYANADCVISVRMHPLILGLIHGVPAVGVARSNKVKHLAKRIGFPLIDPETESSDAIVRRIQEAIESPAPNLDEVEQLARRQFEFAQRHISSSSELDLELSANA